MLVRPYRRALRSDSYPYGRTEEEWLETIRSVRDRWGDREYLREYAIFHEPLLADDEDELERTIWQARLAVSPSAAADFMRVGMDTDITDVLGSIRVPTLVLHREDERGVAGYVGERIRDVHVVELPSPAGFYSD
ncbi:MAG TPA: hypothetical protein VI540_07880 [Gaiellaceae bacterium]|nr:hypothetical protein [Gaiellaceae bacterium]